MSGQPCSFGQRCKFGKTCKKIHTKDDLHYFEIRALKKKLGEKNEEINALRATLVKSEEEMRAVREMHYMRAEIEKERELRYKLIDDNNRIIRTLQSECENHKEEAQKQKKHLEDLKFNQAATVREFLADIERLNRTIRVQNSIIELANLERPSNHPILTLESDCMANVVRHLDINSLAQLRLASKCLKDSTDQAIKLNRHDPPSMWVGRPISLDYISQMTNPFAFNAHFKTPFEIRICEMNEKVMRNLGTYFENVRITVRLYKGYKNYALAFSSVSKCKGVVGLVMVVDEKNLPQTVDQNKLIGCNWLISFEMRRNPSPISNSGTFVSPAVQQTMQSNRSRIGMV